MTGRAANSFDALRILAALAVMVSHSGQVTSGTAQNDVLYRASGGQMTLGGLAVMAFFGMSGYLVTQSWERRKNPVSFVLARILRLWPALFVVVAVTVLLIGPALSSSQDYWTHPDTTAYWQNLLLHQPPGGQRGLPGVFEHSPLPGVVNGPLWTLEYEAAAYSGLFLLGISRLLTRESVTAIACALALILWRIPHTDTQPWLYLALPFVTGSSLALWGEHIIWRRDGALLAMLIMAAGLITGHLSILAGSTGVYALLYVARGSALRGWGRSGDPSYGIYLWGMLVQQIMVARGYGLTPVSNVVLSVPLTLGLALLSWHAVEKRALALAKAGTINWSTRLKATWQR